ncbi:MAG: hypothetical protein K2G55_03480, partial [Lachnospiraceae bacterium]|nr:hypothetical protein [Lachnospiraceae bacterium]
MIKRKVTKIFAACMMAAVLLGSASVDVHAETLTTTFKETEPNDTKETAELIQANKETAQGYAEATFAGRFEVNGYTSEKDPDWYKVYLNAGTQYMTCYVKPFSFSIEDESGNAVITDNYTYADTTRFGRTAYEFKVQKEGYYYVRIVGCDPASGQYEFTVGSPTYAMDTCKISCEEGVINMTASGGTKKAHFDGRVLAVLPKDAVVEYVRLEVKSTLIKSAILINERSGKSLSLDFYPFTKYKLASMNLPVETMWTAELKYNMTTSFAPVLTVQYVYPIYD